MLSENGSSISVSGVVASGNKLRRVRKCEGMRTSSTRPCTSWMRVGTVGVRRLVRPLFVRALDVWREIRSESHEP